MQIDHLHINILLPLLHLHAPPTVAAVVVPPLPHPGHVAGGAEVGHLLPVLIHCLCQGQGLVCK